MATDEQIEEVARVLGINAVMMFKVVWPYGLGLFVAVIFIGYLSSHR